MARVSNEDQQAEDLDDEAIESAHENEYSQNEAIANEFAAKFYLNKGKEKIAKTYMRDARHGYLKWGVTSKVKALDEHYPQLLTQTTARIKLAEGTVNTISGSGSFEVLDLTSVMKASQAISDEIVLETLSRKRGLI